MKKVSSIMSAMAICLMTFFFLSCSKTEVEPTGVSSVSQAADARKQVPVVFHTVATGAEGSTYTGTVVASGGINASGTYIMPTEVHGMALHCTLLLQLPNGTINIRMNCNMVTMDGRWKILEGTGAYENLEGNGPLVMPDDVQEILTGDITWK